MKNNAKGGTLGSDPAGTGSGASTQDPLLSYLWHLDNNGQSAFSSYSGTSGADVNLDNLYQLGSTGKGITVAISDSNIDIDHEDLVANTSVLLSRNYLKTNSSEWPNSKPISTSNTEAHGTAVMGIVGAAAQNGLGARGVAPEVTLAGFNFIDSSQSLSRKLDQANGSSIDIFNYSYGVSTCSVVYTESSYIQQLKNGVTTLRNGKGSLYVKASGNEYIGATTDCDDSLSDDLAYMGNANLEQANTYPYTILVGALNSDGAHTDYSTPGSNLWISAPGGENGLDGPGIISTDLPGCSLGYAATKASNVNNFDKGKNTLNSSCNYVSGLQGTSFSSPIVAGATALILQANPNLTWRDVKHILAKTAVQINPDAGNPAHPLGDELVGHAYDRGWTKNAANYWFHNWYGFGRLDIKAAVEMAQNYSSSLGTLIETKDANDNWIFHSAPLDLAIPDNSATGVTSSLNVTDNLIIESLQISVNVTHDYSTDLGIELTSPSGTTVTLMNINSGIITSNLVDAQFLANAFYGESSLGNWTIKIIDGAFADTGKLTSWKINFFGHAP